MLELLLCAAEREWLEGLVGAMRVVGVEEELLVVVVVVAVVAVVKQTSTAKHDWPRQINGSSETTPAKRNTEARVVWGRDG